MEPLHPEDCIFGDDPEFTRRVLSSLKTALRQNEELPPIKRIAIPPGLVRCMFRGSFSLNFRGRIPQKFLEMILERIAANKKIGNYGKNKPLMGVS